MARVARVPCFEGAFFALPAGGDGVGQRTAHSGRWGARREYQMTFR